MSMSVLVMLVLVLCCLPVLIFSFWSGALSFPLPKRNFTPRDMMLTAEELGEGWQMRREYEGMAPHWEGSLVTEAWNRDFVYKLNGEEIMKISHFVHRFDNRPHARNTFRNEHRSYLHFCAVSPELNALFQPQYAEEWMLCCWKGGPSDEFYICIYQGVYEEFLVSFEIGESVQGVFFPYTSYFRIASWLRILDERAGKLLGKTK